MDDGIFDRLARRVAATPSRRSLVGRGLSAVAAAAVAGSAGLGGEAKKKGKKKKKKGPQGAVCDLTPKLCSSSEECCGGRVCGQNACAIPDRPRCCGGVGQPCSGGCQCCGPDLECQGGKCAYLPR
jgi:hypothetical protein